MDDETRVYLGTMMANIDAGFTRVLGRMDDLINVLKEHREETARRLDGIEARLARTVDVFEWTNIHPRDTGLPVTVWVSADGTVATDICNPGELAHRAAVNAWIDLNRETLAAHWRGAIDGMEMGAMTRPVKP